MQSISTITIGIMPIAITFTQEGRRASVVSRGSNKVSAIDPATHRVLATIAVGRNQKG